jgi:hypothetical protein
VLCKAYYFVSYFSMTVSALLLVLIAAERYVAILYPFRARARWVFTRRKMYAALVSTHVKHMEIFQSTVFYLSYLEI